MNILLLMMAGSGVRFGADIPKQFIRIKDKPIFSYILRGYNACEDIDKIVVVTHADWIDYVEEWKATLGAEKVHNVVAGGATRSESVRNGLSEVSTFASADDVVLIHDATHPYVDVKGNGNFNKETNLIYSFVLFFILYKTIGQIRIRKKISRLILKYNPKSL